MGVDMYYKDYFEKVLMKDETIIDKLNKIKEKNELAKDIINNYDYIDWLIRYLVNDEISTEDIDNLSLLEYFYDKIKEFFDSNYYYDFFDENYFIIKYKELYLKFTSDKKCKIINKSKKYYLFEDIVSKKENENKEKFIKYFDELEEIKKNVPKKLIKEKLK